MGSGVEAERRRGAKAFHFAITCYKSKDQREL